jgi:hypothetical protein
VSNSFAVQGNHDSRFLINVVLTKETGSGSDRRDANAFIAMLIVMFVNCCLLHHLDVVSVLLLV